MTNLLKLTVAQLRKAADIKEKIVSLENELSAIVGVSAIADMTPAVKPVKKKRTMSAETRAKMAAAQQARWIKVKAAKNS